MKLKEELRDVDIDDGPRVMFVPPPGRYSWPPVSEWGAVEWSCWLAQKGWTPPEIVQYLQVDRYRYGLGFKRHDKEAFKWFYTPGPRAVALHASKKPNTLYGGAVGGMKSHSARHDAYRHCFAIPEFRAIIMRRTFPELRRSHLDKMVVESDRINAFFQEEVMVWNKGDSELTFPKTGSKIIFGHCQNPGDEEKYLGDEYDAFYPDEAATYEKEQIIGVAGRLRSTKPDVYPRLIATTNPGGAKTQWLKQWFIDKEVPFADNPRYDPGDYEYIPSMLYDNPYLMDPDGTYHQYESRLFAYSPQRRRQLLNGDWNALTGQFFAEWDPRIHVQRLDIPDGCKIEMWVDWGYSPNPGVIHWVAIFPNGRIYVFAEWVFKQTIAAEVAKRAFTITKEEVLPTAKSKRVSKRVADPSMFAKDGHSGESYADTFHANGVPLVRGDNDRVLGWGRFRHWLAPHPEDGLGWLVYDPDCTYAVRTIPSLVHDKNDPDDVDTSGEDHAADADRYGLMARPSPPRNRRLSTPTLPYSVKSMLNELQQQAERRLGQVK